MRTLLAATAFTTLTSLGLIASIGYIDFAEAGDGGKGYGQSSNGSETSGKGARQSGSALTFYTQGRGSQSTWSGGNSLGSWGGGWGASMAGRGA